MNPGNSNSTPEKIERPIKLFRSLELEELYKIRISKVYKTQKGYRNTSYPLQLSDGSTANLIIYKAEPGILLKIRAANAVSNYLAGEGFPARRTIDHRTLTLTSATRTNYASLYNYLPGDTIPWEAYTQNHIKALGGVMGKMHLALGQMPTASSSSDAQLGLSQPTRQAHIPNVYDELHSIAVRMQSYFARSDVQTAMKTKLGLTLSPTKLAKFPRLLKLCAALPHQQPLHMDFVRGNILFAKEGATSQASTTPATITGILDFEKTALGHPVADIARTLAFLLVDCDKPEAKIRKYFLISGYIKRGKASLDHAKLLEPLLDLFLTYDFYKFLRHNPYEYLGQNYHFVRTRDLLRRRGMIE